MLIGIFVGHRVHHGISKLTFHRTVSGAPIANRPAPLAN
jgi:fumarate reductase subunit D